MFHLYTKSTKISLSDDLSAHEEIQKAHEQLTNVLPILGLLPWYYERNHEIPKQMQISHI